jgi:hypothetical protein
MMISSARSQAASNKAFLSPVMFLSPSPYPASTTHDKASFNGLWSLRNDGSHFQGK